jgi:hypothetical protein
MKSIFRTLAVVLFAVVSITAQAQSLSGNNSSNSSAVTGSYSTTANYFTSPSDQTEHQNYSGQYTVKENSSVVLGAFAPSMSGYNCAATAQAGASQANAGITAALGIPLLLDPGKLCVYFTAANMSLQQAVAIAPSDGALAKKLLTAAHNELCNAGEVYEEVRTAQRASGLDCPLGDDEKKKVDKSVEVQWKSHDTTKPFAPGIDLATENAICGDDPSTECIDRLQKRIDWKSKELATPEL